MRTRTFTHRHLAERLKTRPPEYAAELDRAIVERTPEGIVVDVGTDAYRGLREKYRFARKVEQHERDEKLAFIRQTCAGCVGCDFGRLSPCAQRERLATFTCPMGKWPATGDERATS